MKKTTTLFMLAAAVIATSACAPDRGHGPTVGTSVATEQPTPATVTAGAPDAPVVQPAAVEKDAAWQHVAQQLEAENHQLTAERDYWKAEAGRYEAGLQRAVSELNRMAGAARAQQYQVEATRQAEAPHVWCGTPQVVVVGDQMQVNGVAYNTGATDARGTLHVDLLADGQLVRTNDVQLAIAGRTDQAWTTTFRGSPRGGASYSARVRPEFTAQ